MAGDGCTGFPVRLSLGTNPARRTGDRRQDQWKENPTKDAKAWSE
jgi:hypothetical protein